MVRTSSGILVCALTLCGCPNGGEVATDTATTDTAEPPGTGSTTTTGDAEESTTQSATTVDDPTSEPVSGTTTAGESTSDTSTGDTTTGDTTTGDAITGDSTGDTTTGDSTGDTTTGDTTTGDTTGDTTTGDVSSTGPAEPCGDGDLDPGETCDDGNTDDADACSATCQQQRALSVSVGYGHTCALLDGGVKCWGNNGIGELGLGDTAHRGDGPGEMGDALPFVDLGDGEVVEVDTGSSSTCARFVAGRIKCWGRNADGELGYGDNVYRGLLPDQMGEALPYVDLGAGATAVALATGHYFACALVDDGRVKCWGINWLGQLGLGDKLDRGDEPGEMGDALPPVDLGRGVKALDIYTATVSACALLEGGRVKCWGRNNLGQLGLGDVQSRGDEPGDMGDALPFVDLGQGAVVTTLALGGGHACALLDTQQIKCWGQNDSGQLGYGDTLNRGDGPGEMGDALPPVDLGTGRTAVALAATPNNTCAVLDDATVKCWGDNDWGQLGLGDTQPRGAQSGQMGDDLPVVDLGTNQNAVALASGENGFHHCALLEAGALKCWGGNLRGQLGLGDLAPRGQAPGQMGDALPFVKLFSQQW